MATETWVKETLIDITDSVVASYGDFSRSSHPGHKPLARGGACLLYPG